MVNYCCMTTILNGKQVADKLASNLHQQVADLSTQLSLGILQVGDNPDSTTYIRHKTRLAAKLGINTLVEKLPSTADLHQVQDQLHQWNTSIAITGYIVQLPLPEQLDTAAIISSIEPQKDVDVMSPLSIGQLALSKTAPMPATTRGIFSLLEYYQIDVSGKHVVIIGRSNLVGKPTALSFLHRNATVTITHRQTPDLPNFTKSADILISAIGQPHKITSTYVKPGAVVIDVGLTKTAEGIFGDVEYDSVSQVASAITPVPGGIGPLTVISLLQNLVDMYLLNNN